MKSAHKRIAKRTPWFPAHIKPARSGEYEVRSKACHEQSCAEPHRLHYYKNAGAWEIDFNGIAGDEGFQWRGLTESAL